MANIATYEIKVPPKFMQAISVEYKKMDVRYTDDINPCIVSCVCPYNCDFCTSRLCWKDLEKMLITIEEDSLTIEEDIMIGEKKLMIREMKLTTYYRFICLECKLKYEECLYPLDIKEPDFDA